MLKQWDIVGVPGDMWPWDESASDFFAIIISSGWAREKAGIYWFCPVREGLHRVSGAGMIPVHQIAHPPFVPRASFLSMLQPKPYSAKLPALPSALPSYVKIPYEQPMARMDLMITGGRHELLPWDCGTVDRLTRIALKKELRKFVGL
jgi:hypothetical protein